MAEKTVLVVRKTNAVGKRLWRVNGTYVLAMDIQEALNVFSEVNPDVEVFSVEKSSAADCVWYMNDSTPETESYEIPADAK